MIYRCCTEARRRLVRDHSTINGIDYIEVVDASAPAGSPRQRTLLVRFVKPAPALTREQFEIFGGERIADIAILWATPANAPDPALVTAAEAAFLTDLPEPEQVIALRTNSSGDYSTYTLNLVASPASLAPPPGIDALLARVEFSFKVECPSDFDCAPVRDCPVPANVPPQIDYLAKDYRSFRRLMLDRMAQTIPEWQERNAADLGIALVEMLAYVGDHLSYAQDAVATEAYLGTARRRSSVRRHARLVDYAMHDGANARTWVQVRVRGGPVAVPAGGTPFFTQLTGVDPVVAADALDRLLFQRPTIFEPMHGLTAFEALNDIAFYDWGDSECCLPTGAVRATLVGDLPLSPGDILIFEERLGPRTGNPADADPAKRWAVRLVQVVAGIEDPVPPAPVAITEIRWAAEDALPFPVCLSARGEDGETIRDISHALGNIVLADHGLTLPPRHLGAVPEPHLYLVANGIGPCAPAIKTPVPPRFRPELPDAPLTQAEAYNAPPAAASSALLQDVRRVRPSIALSGTTPLGTSGWEARRDLLASDPDDPHFVVEIENDGTASLRFGDDANGRRPDSGTEFAARYRIGNGPAGNVGADALAHIVSGNGAILGVRNPMPAIGGTVPETSAAVRVAAPQAYRTQERAVTPDDYAAIALRHPGVQRAAATFRWNGHGHTVFVTVDRFGDLSVTPGFRAELVAFIESFRMAGYDLEVDAPRFVALDVALQVCVKPEHFRADVRRALLDELSARRLPDGRLGQFHPDSLTFAQPVWLSATIARAQAVEGVESVAATKFARLDQPDPLPLKSGMLAIGRLEIARLSNDPDFPERGRLILTMGGGK